MDIPESALEFQDRFRTEDDCLEALRKLRWPRCFICPNCQHDDAYFLKERRLMQCVNCRHQASITSGTIFHGTKIPLRNWFWIIYMVAQDKGGASSSRLAEQLNMYQKTVWHILQKVRHAMGNRDDGYSLAGLIELDEAIIGAEARKTGRNKLANFPDGHKGFKRLGRPPLSGAKKKTQTQVLVMVEDRGERAGYVAMKVVDYTDRLDILEIVNQKVEPAQHFKTDGFSAHYVLQSYGHNLDIKVCGGKSSVEWLPHVHRAISLLRRFLFGTYHGVSAKYLPRYLQEFSFRFNRRNHRKPIWQSLLNACLTSLPFTYAELKL